VRSSTTSRCWSGPADADSHEQAAWCGDDIALRADSHIGRLGVSNAIWDKQGSLTETEMERVRMHPYLTQRTFSRSPRLARLAEVAAEHHGRLDGSGYPRALSGSALSPEARLLARPTSIRR
jgi:HD-GYP domain-containing protein (c-di-GMP phosphodiesterase class II)